VTWTGIHCRLSWAADDVDAFIADTLAPMIDHVKQSGLFTDWYFLRYWETGPHLRIRVQDAQPETVDKIVDSLRDLVSAADFPVPEEDLAGYYAAIGATGPLYPHGDIRVTEYVPETARYGGPAALPVAEEFFCRSTEVACAVLRATTTPSARLTAAIDLAIATTKALGLSRPAAATWLRTVATGWRFVQEPGSAPSLTAHTNAHRLLATRGEDLAQRWHRKPVGAIAYWVDACRAAQARLDGPMPRVWASQLHMLFNRLGIRPHEERMVCALVAATALRPTGLGSFHADDETSPDRAYVEASSIMPGFPDQLPVKDNTPARPLTGDTVTLPTPGPVGATLTSALAGRRTIRDFAGSLTAEQLATLLWTAHAPTDDHYPYPSAGAKYCARLRVLALDVDGLAPGTYDVDELTRTLRRITNAPSIADLEATSMWLGDANPRTEPPAVLALYVDLGRLRRTYGLRALRFAYTEAGHLAQNLQLVAAALGVRTGLLGGFYDDLANDVCCLDGVDNTLVYLLPLAA
jgi:thiopeptide-type bacteriocin biosynthesis protein